MLESNSNNEREKIAWVVEPYVGATYRYRNTIGITFNNSFIYIDIERGKDCHSKLLDYYIVNSELILQPNFVVKSICLIILVLTYIVC